MLSRVSRLGADQISISLTAVSAALAILVVTSGAMADIWECRGPDGVHYTNTRERGCKRVVTSTKAKRATRPRARLAPPDPSRYSRYNALITEAAQLYQLPTAFVRAIIRVESDYNPNVVSRTGAMGLMQLMPGTATSMGVRNPFDPRENILGGTRYLRVLANMFNGDLVLTIAAYNAGEGAVMRHRGVPPYEETRRYVQRVLRHYYTYRAEQ